MPHLQRKLHDTYSPQRYDHTDVWVGNLRVTIGGRPYDSTLGRAGSDASDSAGVVGEGYVRDIDWRESAYDLSACVWTDANDLGRIEERGGYQRSAGTYYPTLQSLVYRLS